MSDPSFGPPRIARGYACPQCGSGIERIARRWFDRLLSLWLPVRRYRCRSATCGWEGALQRRSPGSVPNGRPVPVAGSSARGFESHF